MGYSSQTLGITRQELQEACLLDVEVAASATELVRAAAEGDERSWELLVRRYSGRVWGVVQASGLADNDALDAFRATWLRLAQHLKRIREPEATGAWLAATAKTECLRALRRTGRECPADDLDQLKSANRTEGEPETQTAPAERDLMLLQCMDELPERCQALLRALLADPRLSYEEIGSALGMQIGSIDPVRARCLRYLRRRMEQGAHSLDRSRYGIVGAVRGSGAPMNPEEARCTVRKRVNM